MLARLAVLLVALPALALAADVGAQRTGATAPASTQAVQRVATAPVMRPPPPISLPADPAQCRMDCAQTYYVCRAGERPEECAGPWGQCVATCNSPNLAPGYSTAP
ncbi:MAG TPA: hypothetical protein VKQ70_01890 [Caulobacteraceae bacterium]|jgi:hypothetical protein|nr:hypothetical protein [Caulobacteraceae bacterium]